MDIRRGIIRAFDSGIYLADVQIVGSMATMLTGVPVAKQIGADLLTSGTKCGVLFFDETNPSDACVVFVYDGVPGAWITSALIKDGEVGPADLDIDSIHPSARVYHNAHQSIPNASLTALAFNSQRFDTDGIHDTVTNNSRLTCKTAGKYQITVNLCFETNNTGERRVYLRVNGATYIAGSVANAAATSHHFSVSTLYNMDVNDYVEVLVYQSSGGALNVLAGGDYSPEFMMVRVA